MAKVLEDPSPRMPMWGTQKRGRFVEYSMSVGERGHEACARGIRLSVPRLIASVRVGATGNSDGRETSKQYWMNAKKLSKIRESISLATSEYARAEQNRSWKLAVDKSFLVCEESQQGNHLDGAEGQITSALSIGSEWNEATRPAVCYRTIIYTDKTTK